MREIQNRRLKISVTYPPNIVNKDPGFLKPNTLSPVFYVSVEGTVYGPYSDDLMQQYVFEGRIVAQSLISNSPTSGFQPAQMHPNFTQWRPLSQTVTPQALPTVFMVIADIHSGHHLNFLKTLQTLGKVQRLSDTVWIIAAQIELNEMREILSRALSNEDRLFIHDTFANRAGWFNIGETADKDIRSLWMQTAEQRKAMKES